MKYMQGISIFSRMKICIIILWGVYGIITTCEAKDFDDSVLNEYEKANLEILASMDTF